MTDTETAAPEPKAAPTTVTIPLSRPLITHQGEKRELVLKRPTLGTLARHGAPFSITETQGVEGDQTFRVDVFWKNVRDILAELAGVDALIIEDLSAADTTLIFNWLFSVLRGLA